jgi:hypothetical protein
MWDHLPTILTIVSFVFIAGGTLVTLTWKLSRLELSLRGTIQVSRNEIEERQDRVVREFGETVSAMREKVREVELFCRDTFMRRDSFLEANRQNAIEFKAFGERIESRLERMETKIDSKT